MTVSEDEDETLANFLESEILSEEEMKTDLPPLKKKVRFNDDNDDDEAKSSSSGCRTIISMDKNVPRLIDTGLFSKIPPELFHHILKFLSSEDLIACSMVCRFLNHVASDECLWHRLYCMRWGVASPTKKLREFTWKELYIQRDEEDMVQFVRNTPSEFKEYYIQMQVAKRSQTPLPSQVNDDSIILDKTVADQISMWRVSRGLTDEVVADHACSGHTCTYYQIGNVYLCEKTGRVHGRIYSLNVFLLCCFFNCLYYLFLFTFVGRVVLYRSPFLRQCCFFAVCGDTCREVVMDTFTGLWVCTVSGHCFDTLLSPAETEPDAEQQGVTDEAEPFMGSGRFARAYLLGYDCVDEKELKAALRFC
ncbi:hypothetical protein AQUCO_02500164v1 [Aquilegia coerulea]|uniref:F-box domain-containing protein n=1 Tax=Aquilegia coerulea TaxID=218851 RepID=A0A2G5D9S1_AQUCA|nr:hypothetical protein AQUCO_02500164v1 [Aquilegia coerulea]